LVNAANAIELILNLLLLNNLVVETLSSWYRKYGNDNILLEAVAAKINALVLIEDISAYCRDRTDVFAFLLVLFEILDIKYT
jgi:hypothetical protein